MDRASVVAISLALAVSACARQAPAAIQVVGRGCRIALPYVAAEVGDCTPQAAAAYDFAFCHFHYLVGALVAPPADRARGEAGLSAQFRRKAIAYGSLSQTLSDADTFDRNVALARKYYDSLQKQNPMIAGSSLEYVRSQCDNLAAHHATVLQGLDRSQRF